MGIKKIKNKGKCVYVCAVHARELTDHLMKSLMHPLLPAPRPFELVPMQKWVLLILESLECVTECANERGRQNKKRAKNERGFIGDGVMGLYQGLFRRSFSHSVIECGC